MKLVTRDDHCCFRFACVLEKIEEYPEDEQFTRLQRSVRGARELDQSLSGHLTRLLELAGERGGDCSHLAWPLSLVRRRLQETPSALTGLTRQTLRTFIAKLLRIVKKKEGRTRDEAVKCLAEIGPVDLTSEILEEESRTIRDPTETLLSHLVGLLVSSSGELSTRTAETLINLLSVTDEGRAWLSSTDNDGHGDYRKFLLPFQRLKIKPTKSAGFSHDVFSLNVDQGSLWTGSSRSHQEWLIKLVTAMLRSSSEGSVYRLLVETCHVSQSLCETVFPFLVNDIITKTSDDVSIALSVWICKFFELHFEREPAAVNPDSEDSEFPYLRKESLRVMLSAVLYTRQIALSNNCWEQNFKITNINYLHCATAALYCGEHFSALLMCQIWCLKEGISIKFGTNKNDFGESLLERISSLSGCEARKVLDIIFTASREIGDSEAALGVGRLMVEDPTARICQLSLEGRSDLALPLCDSLLVRGGGGMSGLVRSLQSEGLHHTLHQLLQSEGLHHTLHQLLSAGRGTAEQFRAEQQECCWRLERWEELSPDKARGTVSGCVLGGLDSLVRGELEGVRQWADQGTNLLCERLELTSLEATGTVYPLLSQLRQLSELVSLAAASAESEAALVQTLSDLSERDDTPCPSFSLLEPILTQRLLIVSRKAQSQLDCQTLRVSELARREEMFSVCSQLGRFYQRLTPSVRLEQASVIYHQGQRQAGIQLVKKLLAEVESKEDEVKIKSNIYFTLGHWLHQQKSEPSNRILEQYLKKTVSLLEDSPDQSNKQFLVDSYMAVASFADKLYTQTRDFMNSSEFQERIEAAKKVKKEAEILQKAAAKQKDLRFANIIKQKFSSMDNTEALQYEKQRSDYLLTALQNYLSVLSLGDKPLAVYRLLSLWFSDTNSHHTEVCQLLARRLPDVSSSKFIPLLYQMAARVQLPTSSSTEFSSVLFKLMLRCTKEHPHHALPIALALVNAKEDEKYVENAKQAANKENDPRATALSKLISELENSQKESKIVVARYRALCEALIKLAYVAVKDKTIQDKVNPELSRIRDWTNIPVLTDTIPVRADKDYSNSVTGIAKFENYFRMVGGVKYDLQSTIYTKFYDL